jgi:hypothetical protein
LLVTDTNPTLISPLSPSTPPPFYNLSTTTWLAVSRPRTPDLRSRSGQGCEFRCWWDKSVDSRTWEVPVWLIVSFNDLLGHLLVLIIYGHDVYVF